MFDHQTLMRAYTNSLTDLSSNRPCLSPLSPQGLTFNSTVIPTKTAEAIIRIIITNTIPDDDIFEILSSKSLREKLFKKLQGIQKI